MMRLFFKRSKKKRMADSEKSSCSEKPAIEDCFSVKERIVKRIHDLIKDSSLSDSFIIAITGEWGSGKTTAMNFLREELNKENILIEFEPLLEKKFKIDEIMESFYLKLYSSLEKDDKAIVKKLFKSLLILSRSKLEIHKEISAGIATAGGSIEYNWGENVDKLMGLWEKEAPKFFSEQISELNIILKKNKKTCVFIDEIDRLPAKQIINFLMFARLLEVFKNLVCIICIDYERVMEKLIKEGELGLGSYSSAQSYIDKLFQYKFHVHHRGDQKILFAQGRLKNLGIDKIFDEFSDSKKNTDYANKFEKIITYLSTIRQIKKWLLSIQLNYALIESLPKNSDFISNVLVFFGFIALIVKHPVIVENITKNIDIFLMLDFNPKHGDPFQFNKDSTEEERWIALSGIKNTDIIQKVFNKQLQKKLKETFICQIPSDHLSEYFLKKFFSIIPKTIILAFFEGYLDKNLLYLYNDFFTDKVDSVLEYLITENSKKALNLAYDLSAAISKNPDKSKIKPSIELINKLTRKKEMKFGNIFAISYDLSYYKIALFLLNCVSNMDIVIKEANIDLSEHYVGIILYLFNIKNESGIYKLSKFKGCTEIDINNKNLNNIIFNGKLIKDFDEETVVAIVSSWINKVQKKLGKLDAEDFTQENIISVFYRYIQWNTMLKESESQTEKISSTESSEFLSCVAKKFLLKMDVPQVKAFLGLLLTECAKFLNPLAGVTDESKNPLKILFGGDKDLINTISKFIEKDSDIQYADAFKECVALLNVKDKNSE